MASLTAKTATLMTREEKDLVHASQPKSLEKLGEALLRTEIERARHLRKHYEDFLHREQAVAQSQRAPRGSRAAQGNAKTLLKVTAFTAALARLEQESARRSGAIMPGAAKPASKKTSKKKKTPKMASTVSSKKTAKAESRSKITGRTTSTAPAANGRIDRKKSDPKSVATERPRSKEQSGDLRAKQNELRLQRGPSMQQLGHAAARGRRVQARRDAIATRTGNQRSQATRADR